jgi:DNA invertase Pin-like site-specific DNA recombinase
MLYGYIKAIKEISVANQVDILISHKVGKEHIYTSLDDIPIKQGDILLICRLDVLDMTFGQLHRYFTDLESKGVNLFSITDEVTTTDQAFIKAFRNLYNNEVNVRGELGIRSRKKALAAGKKPGAKKAIGPEQEKVIHDLLKNGYSFKEIYETIGIDRKTFYWWRKRNNVDISNENSP